MTRHSSDTLWQEKSDDVRVKKPRGVYAATSSILTRRGISESADIAAFLKPDYEEHTHDPFLFVQMQLLVDRIRVALRKGEVVGIFGDHDVDGISAATLMAEMLEKLELDYHVTIPSKHHDGHGLNTRAIDAFYALDVTLLVTVDCGSSNASEIAYAKTKGMDTIVIDHHLPPDELPETAALINPVMQESGYPFSGLCGTACVFKVVEALYKTFYPEEIEQLKWFLDVVAVATIADCMPLVGENRIFVRYGLVVLLQSRRLGFREMIAVGEIGKYDGGEITAETVAFQIAPRINAAGRMGDARDAYLLLRETDPAIATVRAREIDATNIARRKKTEELSKKAEKIVKADFLDKSFIFIAGDDYPIGLVGIIAGRIAHKYAKPVGVFMYEGDTARGSFRSPEDVHIVEILAEVSSHLEKYGGHARAAGATLKKDSIPAFIDAATSAINEHTEVTSSENIFSVDLKLIASAIDDGLREELVQFAPYGHGNPEPVLWITQLVVESVRPVGKTGKHLKFVFYKADDGSLIEGIGFSLLGKIPEVSSGDAVEILGNIRANHFRGNITTQIVLHDLRLVEK